MTNDQIINHLAEETKADFSRSDFQPYPIKEPRKSNSTEPLYHHSVILAAAFNLAYSNYASVRRYNDGQPITETSNRNALIVLATFLHKMTSDILVGIKQNNLELLTEFAQLEPSIFRIVQKLRNYHSHVIHEPGPIKMLDLFDGKDGRLNQQQWNAVRQWFEKRFNETKTHLLKSLNESHRKVKEDRTIKNKRSILEEIEKALQEIEFTFLFDKQGEYLTDKGQLFIACMFLRKSQAVYLINKWKGIKRTTGYYKTVQTLYTYYSIKDKHTILNDHGDLSYFRSLLSQLTKVPYISNAHLEQLYLKIGELNEAVYKKKDEAKTKHSKHNEKLKAVGLAISDAEKEKQRKELENLERQIISIQKNRDITSILLKFLEDQSALDKFEIACFKSTADRLAGTETMKGKSLNELLREAKGEADPEKKRIIREILKEQRRNFIFKKPAIGSGNNYCTKHRNAILRYEVNGNKVNVTVPPAVLTKWAFVVMEGNKDEISAFQNKLISSIQNWHYKFSRSTNFEDDLQKVNALQSLPRSVKKQFNGQEEIAANNIIKTLVSRIKAKKHEIDYFCRENKVQAKPWRYASRKKLNYIFELNHHLYLKKVQLSNSLDINQIRHDSLRSYEFMELYQLFRFFSSRKEQILKNEKFRSPYFDGIRKFVDQSKTLEELATDAIETYYNELSNILSLNPSNMAFYASLFKVKRSHKKSDVQNSIRQSFQHNIYLSPNSFLVTMAKPSGQSDYTFIRQQLELKENVKGFTNIDYLLKNVAPTLKGQPFEKKFPLFNEHEKLNPIAFIKLLEAKTEELIIWNVAKYYWRKATNAPIMLEAHKESENSFLGQNYFNTIFCKDVLITKEVDGKTFQIRVPVRKIDDEFQYFEKDYLQDYLKYHQTDTNTTLDYLETKRAVSKELLGSLKEISLLLNAEKQLLSRDTKKFIEQLVTMAKNKNIVDDFYLDFDIVIPELLQHFKALSLNPETLPKELKKFRNNALHNQLQNPAVQEIIRDELEKIIPNYHFNKAKALSAANP